MEFLGKRWQLRLLAGLLAIFVTLYFSTGLFGGIRADDGAADIGESGGDDGIMSLAMNETYYIMDEGSPFVIDDCTVKIGGQTVTPGTAFNVYDGQAFELSFNWHIQDISHDNYQGCSFVYANFGSRLGGIKIPNVSGPLNNSDPTKGSYSIENGRLIITMGDQEAVYSYTGDLKIEGAIEINGEPDSDTGEFKIEFGKDWSWLLRDPSVGNVDKPALYARKAAQGTVTKAADGNYYQNYTITIGHEQWSQADATGVVLTDEHGTLFANGSLSNVTLNGAPLSADRISTNGHIDTIRIGNLPKDQTATLTYRMKIDDPKLLVNGFGNWNNIRATSENGGWAEGRDDAKYDPPAVTKTGSLAANGKVEWTITADPGIFGENESFTITDTLSGTGIPTATNTFSKAQFTKNADGKYTYTYTTDAPAADTATDKSVTNKAVLTMLGESKENSATVTIPASGSTGNIDKTHGTVSDLSDGSILIPWTVTISVPDTALKSLTVTDTNPDAWRFDATKAEIDYSSMSLSVDGVSYTPSQRAGGYDLQNGGTVIGAVEPAWMPNVQFNVKFTDSGVLNSIKGKTLTLTYNLTLKDESISRFTNRVSLNAVPTAGTIPGKSDEDTFQKPITVEKYGAWHPGNDNTKYMQAWEIRVTANAGTYSAGDKITITDTLPTGYVLIDDSTSQNHPIFTINGADVSGISYAVTSSSTGSFVMEVTVNDALASALSAGGRFSVRYCANMEDTYYQEELNKGNHTLNLKNTAEVEVNGGKGHASVDYDIQVAAPNPILSKGITSETRTTNPDGTRGFRAKYEIRVNSDRADLSAVDTLRVYDTLGTKLKLIDGSIQIKAYPVNNWTEEAITDESYSLRTLGGKNQIVFTLHDNTYYVITYEVEGTELLNANDLTDPNYRDELEKEIENRYGNTVQLNTKTGTSQNSSATISAGSFRLNASVSYKLLINGTKRWPASDPDRPDEITLKLTRTEKYIQPIAQTIGKSEEKKEYLYHLVTEADQLRSDTVSELWRKVDIASDGSWKFIIDDLIVTDQKGSDYSYIIEEVAIDGYTPIYRFKSASSSGGWTYEGRDGSGYIISDATTGSVTAEISNAKTENTSRPGAIHLVKTDANDPGHSPLAGVKFEITTANGSLGSASVSGAADVVPEAKKLTFTTTAAAAEIGNLPEGTYVLREIDAPIGYVRDLTQFEFTVRTRGEVQAAGVGNYIFDSGSATVTVSNALSEFSVNKFAIGGTRQLADAELTITGSADLSKVTVTNGTLVTAENGKFAFKTIDDVPAVITGLPAGSYTLTETAAPKGYETTTSFAFTMNADGTVAAGTGNGAVNTLDAATNTITLYDEPKTGKITVKKLDENSAPLSGAAFRLTPRTSGISVSNVTVSGANVTAQTAASAEFETNGNDIVIDKLPIGRYTLAEITAPSGYSPVDDFLFEIALNNDGSVSVKSGDPCFTNGTAALVDERIVPGTLRITKRGDGVSYLADAEFTITTADGKLNGVTLNNADVSVQEEKTLVFKTKAEGAVRISNLAAGTYTLTESASPSGYIRDTSSFTFTVDNTGTVAQAPNNTGNYTFSGAAVSLTDRITEFRIAKVDMTGGEQLPGATLAITKDAGEGAKDFSNVKVENAKSEATVNDSEDSVTFVTSSDIAVVKGLPEGKYVLTETAAPDGYAVTTRFYFTVDQNGRITKTAGTNNADNELDEPAKTITLKDKAITVRIDKTDLGGAHLSGARIEIRNTDGKILGKVKVENASGTVQQSLTSDTLSFTTGDKIAVLTGLPAGNYVLTETAAPNGYQKTETEFRFKIDTNGAVSEITTGTPAADITLSGNTITVKDKPKEEKPDQPDEPDKPDDTTGSSPQPTGTQPTGSRPSGGSRPTGTTAPTATTTTGKTTTTTPRSTLTEPDEVEPEKSSAGTTAKPGQTTTTTTTAPKSESSKTTKTESRTTDDNPGSGIDSNQTTRDENPYTGVSLTPLTALFAATGTLAVVTRKKKKK